jgi:hypothetical protein
MLADQPSEYDEEVKLAPPDHVPAVRSRGFGRSAPQAANLKFIAAARTLVPELIAEVRRLRKAQTPSSG